MPEDKNGEFLFGIPLKRPLDYLEKVQVFSGSRIMIFSKTMLLGWSVLEKNAMTVKL